MGGWSLGMKQRLALAGALLGDPRVLVLDEPGNGLDPEGIAWLRAFLREFAQRGRSVLVSSHLLAEMEQTVDQLVVINPGRCVYQGGLEELRSRRGARVLVAAPPRSGWPRRWPPPGSRRSTRCPTGGWPWPGWTRRGSATWRSRPASP